MKTSTTTTNKFFATLFIAVAIFATTATAQTKTIGFSNISVNSGSQWVGNNQVPFTKVMLNWNIDASQMIKSIEVENSFDMINFNTVTTGVQAISANEKISSYTFEDASPALTKNPIAVYRVKITDVYGKVTYTETKLVSLRS